MVESPTNLRAGDHDHWSMVFNLDVFDGFASLIEIWYITYSQYLTEATVPRRQLP